MDNTFRRIFKNIRDDLCIALIIADNITDVSLLQQLVNSDKPIQNCLDMIVAKTERLILKQFSKRNAKGFYELNNDPIVLQYTGDKPFTSLVEAEKFIASYTHYAQHGFGRWALLAKTNHEFVGFCGLKRSTETGDVDIGFRLKQQYWGQGLATESAEAALQLGFTTYQLSTIIARAMVKNQASIAVIKKLGMRFCTHFEENNHQWSIFELTYQNWLQED